MQCRSTQLRSETVIILVRTQKVQHERITKVSEWRSCEAMLISMTEEPVLCFTTGLILFKSSCGLRAMFLVMHGFTWRPAEACRQGDLGRLLFYGKRLCGGAAVFLTDPMPESAMESPPQSVACVLLFAGETIFSRSPSTGQSILAVIWVVFKLLSMDWNSSFSGGVTVMLGTGLSMLLNGLELEFTASVDAHFVDCARPEEGLCRVP